jgi:hypothetical protein
VPGGTYTCTITNDDVAPTLTVIKHVINNNGGSAAASAWTMNVAGTNVSSTGFAGSESPGTTITVNANASYAVTESGGPSGYSLSSSAACSSAGLAPGSTATSQLQRQQLATFRLFPASQPGQRALRTVCFLPTFTFAGVIGHAPTAMAPLSISTVLVFP